MSGLLTRLPKGGSILNAFLAILVLIGFYLYYHPMLLAFGLFVMAGILLCIAACRTWVREMQKDRNARILQELDGAVLAPLKTTGGGLILGYKEQLYVVLPAKLLRSTPHRVGGFGGVSIPLFGRLSGFLGRYGSHNKSNFQNCGKGQVYVTDHGLLFSGKTDNYMLWFRDIRALQLLPDGIRIDAFNDKPVKIITGDARLYAIIKKLMKG